MYYILACNTFYYSLFIYFPIQYHCSVRTRQRHPYTNICTTYHVTFWYTYFDRNICWMMVIGGNESSFRARNKSRTAIYQFTISNQFSRCGMRLIVMCNQLKKTLVRLYIDIRLAHKQHANHFLSAHSIWYIFFHVWQFVLLLLEWGRLLCVQPAEKSLFICDMCIVHVQRYVRFTVVCREPPPRYPLNIIYTYPRHINLYILYIPSTMMVVDCSSWFTVHDGIDITKW